MQFCLQFRLQFSFPNKICKQKNTNIRDKCHSTTRFRQIWPTYNGKQGKVSYNVLFMKNYNFVRFYFGKERWHLQSEVKRNYVMALKVAPKNKLLTSSTIPYLPKTRLGSLLITIKLPLMYMCTYFHESGQFRSLRISVFQNIPLPYIK